MLCNKVSSSTVSIFLLSVKLSSSFSSEEQRQNTGLDGCIHEAKIGTCVEGKNAGANAGANASPEMRERRRAATADPCVLWPLPVPLRSAHGNRTWDWGECQMEVPMQVGVPTHRKLMSENCGVRAAHSARDGARPQPLTLALWSLPVPLRPAHVGMEHGSRGDCQMDRGTGIWNGYIQWCSWWIL